MTPEQIMSFQRGRRDWLGNKLKADGVWGPKTAWAVMYAGLPTWRRNVISVCQLLVGLQEVVGPNQGPVLDNMLRFVDVAPGNPWCAAAASAALRLGTQSLWETRFGKEKLGIGGALELQRMLFQMKEPAPGDVFAYATDAQGHGHTGVIAGVTATELLTFEGNQRNEYRLLRRPRDARLKFGTMDLRSPEDHVLESLGTSVELVPIGGLAGTT